MKKSSKSDSVPGQEENRRHPRYACKGYAEVHLPHGNLLFRGEILNLSLSGCYVATPSLDLERGTHVEVYFVTRQLLFRVAGVITAPHRRRGTGIAFQHVSVRRAEHIRTLVEELAAF